jgi:hypothetical protein
MSTDATKPATVNHVFIDFENVHLIDLSLIGAESYHFTLFIGSKQTKLDTALVEALLAHASSVQLVRVTTSGKNALDLVLAAYVGQAVLANPTARFHIVSKDKDYDALITHLRGRRIAIQRHADCTMLGAGPKSPRPELKAAAKAPAKTKPEKPDAYGKLVATLKSITARPKTKKRLFGLMKSHLEKDAGEEAMEGVFERLKADGHLSCDDKGRIDYRFAKPEAGSAAAPAGDNASIPPVSEDLLFPMPCPSTNPKSPNTPP